MKNFFALTGLSAGLALQMPHVQAASTSLASAASLVQVHRQTYVAATVPGAAGCIPPGLPPGADGSAQPPRMARGHVAPPLMALSQLSAAEVSTKLGLAAATQDELSSLITLIQQRISVSRSFEPALRVDQVLSAMAAEMQTEAEFLASTSQRLRSIYAQLNASQVAQMELLLAPCRPGNTA